MSNNQTHRLAFILNANVANKQQFISDVQADLHSRLNEYDAICVRSATKVRQDLIDACPNLKAIGRGGVGLDNIDVDYAKSKGIAVINTPAASSRSVGELAMAHLLGLSIFLAQSNRQMPLEGDTKFNDLKKAYAKGTELEGKTLGIIGLGRIGQEAARCGLGMGMNVLAVDPFVSEVALYVGHSSLGFKVTVKTVSMDDLLAEADYISLHWLAAGKLHILAGAPGTGKTTLALALAADLTTAGRWPDGARVPSAGNVLIWSGEDDPIDTLVPRLIACGADMTKIHFVSSVRQGSDIRPFDPANDMRELAEAAIRVGDVRMLICDPVVSAVAGDSHKNTEVRRALQPLVDLGIEPGCAILGISHFIKGSQGRDPTESVSGSLAFGALARVVLTAAKVLDDESEHAGRRILARTKSNIGPDDGAIYYDIEQVEVTDYPGVWASRVAWGERIEGAAREILAAPTPRPPTLGRADRSRLRSRRWSRA